MGKKIFLLFSLLSIWIIGHGQPLIRTVQCYPVGRPFAEPVIELGSNQQLFFCFDDLSSEVNNYTYKIMHCDPNWAPSGLSPFHYLSGFFEYPIEDYKYSYNTQKEYTHFSLLIPNQDVGIKISGNYLLQVFNENDSDSAVITQRFSVLERKVAISAAVLNANTPQLLNTSQQLNFTISYANLPLYNPMKDLRVYVTQNQDPNSRRDFVPTFVRQNQLVYGDGMNNIFHGLSPFRNFQCSSFVYYTQYVKDVIKGPDGMYHFILQPGVVPERYVPLPNKNGNFYIEAENVQDPNVEADYIVANFAILSPQRISDADIYVYGKFSNWQLLPELKMTYDDKNKAYVGEAELKQGYYDYMYAVVPTVTRKIELVPLQNNFYQTLNQYQIRCYVYDYNLMCFRFVGYKEVKK